MKTIAHTVAPQLFGMCCKTSCECVLNTDSDNKITASICKVKNKNYCLRLAVSILLKTFSLKGPSSFVKRLKQKVAILKQFVQFFHG